jgi:hypothetical protein
LFQVRTFIEIKALQKIVLEFRKSLVLSKNLGVSALSPLGSHASHIQREVRPVPVQVSYPGVYVRSITSPQPPVGGASTSIAAFVGRAPRGPVNKATPLLNYAAYARAFGGLNKDSAISYQANAFFSNGGSQAVVVRLYSPPLRTSVTIGGNPASTDTFTLTYTITGSAQPPIVVTGKTTASDVAGALNTALSTAFKGQQVTASQGPGKNANVVTIAFPTPSSGTTPSPGPAITFSASVTTSSAPQAQPGGTISIADPATISTTGIATIPLYTSMVVTLSGSLAVGDVLTLFFTPPGSPVIQINFPAATNTLADAVTGLANAVNNKPSVSRLVSATADTTASTITFTYNSPVEITTSITGSAKLTAALSSPLPFSLQAADPGVWGNEITASIVTIPASSPLYQRFNLDPNATPPQTLFNLTIWYFDGTSYQTESFPNVTLAGDENQINRLDKMLANGSPFVRYPPQTPPPAIPISAPNSTKPVVAVGFGAGGVDSAPLSVEDYVGDANTQSGLYALTQLPFGWNMLCVPSDDITDDQGGDQDAAVYQEAAQICVDNNAMLIIDPPTKWYGTWQSGQIANISIDDLGNFSAEQARSAAIYFPRVVISDPLMGGQAKVLPPCGFMAAAWASTDTASGVWKAPAGLDVPIGGIIDLQAHLSDDDSGVLNPQGINALRSFKVGGDVVWGARTMRGSDTLADEYKYLPVRRLLLYIQSSLQQNTLWAVFQPNGASLWAKLQTQVKTFMLGLFSQGAFAGTSADQAFFVKCDATTTPPSDQAARIVNVQVGFAPLYPAEFVVLTVSQQTATKSG